jgi:hypothetical protein
MIRKGNKITMNTFKVIQILTLGVLAVVSLLLAGCLTADMQEDKAGVDLFPKPLGEKVIPLEDQSTFSSFHYVEMDEDGKVLIRQNPLTLAITKRGKNLYGYAFENPNKGHLLIWKDGGANRDSAGVYIIGHFEDSINYLDSVPVLWLPQIPHLGVKWKLDSLREMELVSSDTALFTEVLFTYGEAAEKAPIANGLQKHSTLLFKETAGDTLTYYHFSRGVGCLAFERGVKGKLLAAGTATSFYGRYTGIYKGE